MKLSQASKAALCAAITFGAKRLVFGRKQTCRFLTSNETPMNKGKKFEYEFEANTFQHVEGRNIQLSCEQNEPIPWEEKLCPRKLLTHR